MHAGTNESGDADHFVDRHSHCPHTLRDHDCEPAASSLGGQTGFQDWLFGVDLSYYATSYKILRVRGGARGCFARPIGEHNITVAEDRTQIEIAGGEDQLDCGGMRAGRLRGGGS